MQLSLCMSCMMSFPYIVLSKEKSLISKLNISFTLRCIIMFFVVKCLTTHKIFPVCLLHVCTYRGIWICTVAVKLCAKPSQYIGTWSAESPVRRDASLNVFSVVKCSSVFEKIFFLVNLILAWDLFKTTISSELSGLGGGFCFNMPLVFLNCIKN